MHQIKRESAPRKGVRMTVKAVVFGAVGALALLTIGMGVVQSLRSWEAYSRAVDQQSFNAASDQFIKGTYSMLLERVVTDSALQGAAPADAGVRAKIEGCRKTIKELFDPALALIEQRSFANKQALVDDLKGKIRK